MLSKPAWTVSIKCWGSNRYGQLAYETYGDPLLVDSSIPISIPRLTSGITAISAGTRHTCALTSSGGVKCFGSNYYGQLGNNSDEEPDVTDVFGLNSGVASLFSGYYTPYAITSAGRVW